MGPVIFTAAVAAFLVLMLAASTPFLLGAKAVSANGSTHVVVTDAKVGPYQMRVGILPGNPKVGTLHLSIVVQDAETGGAIADAAVMVMATGPVGATKAGPMPALNTPQNPQFYDADINLDMEGSWTLTLETDSELGPASLNVPLEVTESGSLNFIYPIVGIIAALIIAIWS